MNTNKTTAAVPSSTAGSVINSKDATPKKNMMNGNANFPPGPNMVDPTKAKMGMTGKAPAPPPKEGVQGANERVQNYINNLETTGMPKMAGTNSLG